MKILWVCNLILPEIAEDMGLSSIPKEGWVKGLLDAILDSGDSADVQICLAFPVGKNVAKSGVINGEISLKEHEGKTLEYYGFYEDTAHESVYDPKLEQIFSRVFELAKPDLVHCFGTEFPHTLAVAKAWNDPTTLLIGIQGVCTHYAERYTAHLSPEVVTRHTFRDRLKSDSIYEQKLKYEKRGEHEREAVARAGHIAGRTSYDKRYALSWNPDADYHHAGETLRKVFYTGAWEPGNASKYRIFVSQADYPLKGFHYLLIAVGEILRNPDFQGDIQIYVAGQSVMNTDSLKQKIKISSYGKYLNELLDTYGIRDRIHVLGRLSADQMKEQYLKCGMYVCCSAAENSPNSLGEAMMLQVPIVTSEVGGISTIFSVDEDGFSFRNEETDSLEEVAGALKKAMMDSWNGWGKMGEDSVMAVSSETDRRRHNAGFHARQNHDPQQNAREMIDIYRKMC